MVNYGDVFCKIFQRELTFARPLLLWLDRNMSFEFFQPFSLFILFIYSASSPVVVWLEKQGVGIYWNSFQIFANKLGLPTVCADVLDHSQDYLLYFDKTMI